jgi:hypothetical protein
MFYSRYNPPPTDHIKLNQISQHLCGLTDISLYEMNYEIMINYKMIMVEIIKHVQIYKENNPTFILNPWSKGLPKDVPIKFNIYQSEWFEEFKKADKMYKYATRQRTILAADKNRRIVNAIKIQTRFRGANVRWQFPCFGFRD